MLVFTFSVLDWKHPLLDKFDTYTNSNMQNSMEVFTFSVIEQKRLFWGKFGPKKQNGQFKVKFSTKSNSNMPDSMVVSTFSVLDQKCSLRQI